jgi:hypothetical protein
LPVAPEVVVDEAADAASDTVAAVDGQATTQDDAHGR